MTKHRAVVMRSRLEKLQSMYRSLAVALQLTGYKADVPGDPLCWIRENEGLKEEVETLRETLSQRSSREEYWKEVCAKKEKEIERLKRELAVRERRDREKQSHRINRYWGR
jgi:hypothetical protein